MNKCRVCDNSTNNQIVTLKEMMFGTKEAFKYVKCSKCLSLSILNIPDNLGDYYPDNYYSFDSKNQSQKKTLTNKLKTLRDHDYIGNKNLIGSLLNIISPPKKHRMIVFRYINEIYKNNENARILDVGCGNGYFIHALNNLNFKDIYGLDPFLQKEIIINNHSKIYKENLEDHKENYHGLMFNHSLEHMVDPNGALKHANRLLRHFNGKLLVRIPVIDCLAYEEFHDNWFQLDPPRHLILFAKQAFIDLANQNGFKLDKIIFDSRPEQFLRSILLKNNITIDKQNISNSFSKKELLEYEKKSQEVNSEENGDQCCFYFSIKE